MIPAAPQMRGREGEEHQMVQEIGSVDYIENLSNEQLSELMGKCQDMIDDGSATIDEFEAFVICQRELARRTWA